MAQFSVGNAEIENKQKKTKNLKNKLFYCDFFFGFFMQNLTAQEISRFSTDFYSRKYELSG